MTKMKRHGLRKGKMISKNSIMYLLSCFEVNVRRHTYHFEMSRRFFTGNLRCHLCVYCQGLVLQCSFYRKTKIVSWLRISTQFHNPKMIEVFLYKTLASGFVAVVMFKYLHQFFY